MIYKSKSSETKYIRANQPVMTDSYFGELPAFRINRIL